MLFCASIMFVKTIFLNIFCIKVVIISFLLKEKVLFLVLLQIIFVHLHAVYRKGASYA